MLKTPPPCNSGGGVVVYPYMKNFTSRAIILFTAFIIASFFDINASSPRYLALVDSADNYIKRERWADAENTLLSALRLEPGNFANALLLSNLGVVRTRLGKTEEALEAFRLGLSVAPRSSVIRTNRARTHIAIGDYKAAMKDLDETLQIDSLQKWPHYMRGLLRLAANDTEGAENDFKRLSQLDPSDASAMSGLARVAEQKGNLSDALRYYDESIVIDDNPETRFSRILLKINMEKYSDASEDLADAIGKWPQIPDFYLARGYLHRLNFRNDEADLDKKIAIDKGADPKLVEQFFPDTRR